MINKGICINFPTSSNCLVNLISLSEGLGLQKGDYELQLFLMLSF